MLIAIPTEHGCLANHFGRCRQVSLFHVDQAASRIQQEQTLDMPPHEPGAFPTWLRDHGVTVVIAGGMGPKALMLFGQAGIRVVVGAPATNPRQLIAAFLADRLTGGVNTCNHAPDHECTH